MPLSWNEIKTRAAAFAKEWEGTQREEADAKPFLDAFFNVFDVSRRKIGTSFACVPGTRMHKKHTLLLS
jgi:hypothetical protein